MGKKYGRLNKETWRDDLRAGFAEAFRVLWLHGVLIFKWNETQIPLIATRGAGLERKHAGIKQVVYSPLGAHSEKPWKFATGWNCFTAMCRALSCLAAARRQAGTTGEISAPPPRLNCCPAAPSML
jgi:hypothetical protein